MAEKIYQPPKYLENPFVKNLDEFQAMYEASIKDPKTFFGDQAEENLSWIEPFSIIHNGEFANARWFEGGKINIAYNLSLIHISEPTRPY